MTNQEHDTKTPVEAVPSASELAAHIGAKVEESIDRGEFLEGFRYWWPIERKETAGGYTQSVMMTQKQREHWVTERGIQSKNEAIVEAWDEFNRFQASIPKTVIVHYDVLA